LKNSVLRVAVLFSSHTGGGTSFTFDQSASSLGDDGGQRREGALPELVAGDTIVMVPSGAMLSQKGYRERRVRGRFADQRSRIGRNRQRERQPAAVCLRKWRAVDALFMMFTSALPATAANSVIPGRGPSFGETHRDRERSSLVAPVDTTARIRSHHRSRPDQ
jgi:hypothetical protein